VRFYGIFGDADYFCIQLFVFSTTVTENAGFFCAARGVIFGVKEQNKPFAGIVGEIMGLAGLIGKTEVGGFHN